jgi:hypothetical protein
LKQKAEDSKVIIRNGKSKKDMQYNGQKKKAKKRSNALQNTTPTRLSYMNLTTKSL